MLKVHASCSLGPLLVTGLAWSLVVAASALANPIPPSGIPLTPTAIASGGQITTSHGIEFVTIGAAGNAPWMGDGTPQDRAIGRGSVGYEYRIGRFEVTTAQWVEFYNAAFDRPADDRIPHLIPSDHWGAVSTPAMTPGGQRWRVPAGNDYRAVGDISWRMAAIYCNWLHNDKATNREAFLSGAYDVSTFEVGGPPDQEARSPGARYFIPTWDEWLKAAHYDPNRNGPDQGGWWTWSNATDVGIIPGPPPSIIPGGGTGGADGQANSGAWWMTHPSPSPFSVPLGSYPTVQSPWGLLDVAGGTNEWTESILIGPGVPPNRFVDGSWWFDGPPGADRIGSVGSQFPNVSIFQYGFRIAAVVPSPTSATVCVIGCFLFTGRRRGRGRSGNANGLPAQGACRPLQPPLKKRRAVGDRGSGDTQWSRGWLAAAMIGLGLSVAATAHANPVPPSGIPLTPTAVASGGQITVSHGIEFVTIGAPGNAPWMGDGTPQDRAIGRGGVNYEYRIGRFEVTTAQWVEFYNAAFDRPADDRIPHLIPSDHWGAVSTPAMTPGGQRWAVPAGNEYRAVGDISWRMAAIYCNWLHNDKATNREAFLSGAYDVSTFGIDDNGFTDQAARSPGARYFIPTWDEWLKAAHYDPNRHGQDQGGWWTWSNATDMGIIPGPPPSLIPGGGTGGADGQANSGGWGQIHSGLSPFAVPLGSYPTVQSPWGLLDVAGGTNEWTETIVALPGTAPERLLDGSWWFDGPPISDRINAHGTQSPNVSIFQYGFRIAAVVPSPASGVMFTLGFFLFTHRRRR